jgi:SAM-dependent methyltransferase
LRGARTVVNVGAGTGSYEPRDRYVLAMEPSAAMRAARPPESPPAIDAVAEALPLDDDAVDAATAFLTLHHWEDPIRGLRELRRVARRAAIVLTFDVERLATYWLIADYLPEVDVDNRRRFPSIETVCEALGGASVEVVPIPHDCSDGFLEAYFARPEELLDLRVRAAQSGWRRLPRSVAERAVTRLERDLRTGRWDERHGALRRLESYDGGLRLLTAPATDE